MKKHHKEIFKIGNPYMLLGGLMLSAMVSVYISYLINIFSWDYPNSLLIKIFYKAGYVLYNRVLSNNPYLNFQKASFFIPFFILSIVPVLIYLKSIKSKKDL